MCRSRNRVKKFKAQRHRTKITVGASFVLLLTAALLFDAGGVIASITLAAALHEAAHFLALRAFGAPVRSFCLTLFGGEIRLEPWESLSYAQEILAAAAGPAANIALAISASCLGAYFFAGVNLVLGIFNLFPLRQLDGGRILYLALSALIDPVFADHAAHVCTLVCGAALICALGAYFAYGGEGLAAFIPLAWLLWAEAQEVGIVKTPRTV